MNPRLFTSALHVADETLTLRRQGYEFISARCRSLKTDAFETRLLGQSTVCLLGREAAAFFYDEENFSRFQAAPTRVKKTLFGEGGVQGLDDKAHHDRKALFLDCLAPGHISEFLKVASTTLDRHMQVWPSERRVALLDELTEALCSAMLTWCGIPSFNSRRLTRDFRLLIEGPASVGRTYIRARLARKRLDKWLTRVVARERLSPVADPDSPFSRFVWYRKSGGLLLPDEIVAVELNNLIRPTIAVAWFGVAVAWFMHNYPSKIPRRDDETAQRNFVQEVRRLHPFFPFVAARAKKPLSFRGHPIRPGQLVLLDLYGTNRDARRWDQPDEFRPERFSMRQPDAYEFIPQGGGDHLMGHRCAGEWLTIELMVLLLEKLTSVQYDVPQQNLTVSLRTIPARPKSGFIIDNVGSIALT